MVVSLTLVVHFRAQGLVALGADRVAQEDLSPQLLPSGWQRLAAVTAFPCLGLMAIFWARAEVWARRDATDLASSWHCSALVVSGNFDPRLRVNLHSEAPPVQIGSPYRYSSCEAGTTVDVEWNSAGCNGAVDAVCSPTEIAHPNHRSAMRMRRVSSLRRRVTTKPPGQRVR
jgi:hypothetical protein